MIGLNIKNRITLSDLTPSANYKYSRHKSGKTSNKIRYQLLYLLLIPFVIYVVHLCVDHQHFHPIITLNHLLVLLIHLTQVIQRN